jgi:Phytanoyl-CoA dioxygenase (PhyH)
MAQKTAHLSQAERDHYQSEGWVVPEFRLSPSYINTLVGALNELIHRNPGVRPEKLVSAHIERQGTQDNGEGVRGVADFLQLAKNPDIVDLVSDVIGQDIILWGAHVFCKPAGDGFETPWHQDGHYWPIRPLATCTVWVALEESIIENGCLRVIPKSHINKQLHEHLHEDRLDLTLQQRMKAGSFNENTAVNIELQPGQMSLHDIYMIHGAAANKSNKRRTGIALRYMPATSLFDRRLKPVDGKTGVSVNFAERPIWLLKGIDKTGLNDFVVGHANQVNVIT